MRTKSEKLSFLAQPFLRICFGQTLCWLWLLLMTSEIEALGLSQLPSDFSGPGAVQIGEVAENVVLLVLGITCWRKISTLFEKPAFTFVLLTLMTFCSICVAIAPFLGALGPDSGFVFLLATKCLLSASLLFQGIGVSFIVARFDWRSVLLVSALPVIVAAVLTPVFQLCPSVVRSVALVLLPLVILWALCSKEWVFAPAGTTETFALPKFPGRYCFTAFAQGLSAGVVFGFAFAALAIASSGLVENIALVLGSLLVLFTVFVCKLDYNRLLYRCGIPLLSLGLLYLALTSASPLAGALIYLSGYYFMNTIMNCLNIYFIKQYRFSPVYIVGVATLALLAGKTIGSQSSFYLSLALGEAATTPVVLMVVAVLLPICALFCLNERNMVSGWGVFKPDAHANPDDFSDAVDRVAQQAELSDRELEVYRLLVRGWSRKRISGELLISEETVKSYASKIYRKLNVHSRQELIEAVEHQSLSVY